MRTISIELVQHATSKTIAIQASLNLHPGPLKAGSAGLMVRQYTQGDLTEHDLQRVVVAIWECLNTWGYAPGPLF